MTDHRKRYDGTFKARIVLESLKEEKTTAELASEYHVHPNQIAQWRKQALENLPSLFDSKQAKNEKAAGEERGRSANSRWRRNGLKKVGDSPLEEKRELVDVNHKVIPICRQCELLRLARSSFYYKPVAVSDFNLHLMKLIDRQYTKDPSSDVSRMTTWLKKGSTGSASAASCGRWGSRVSFPKRSSPGRTRSTKSTPIS